MSQQTDFLYDTIDKMSQSDLHIVKLILNDYLQRVQHRQHKLEKTSWFKTYFTFTNLLFCIFWMFLLIIFYYEISFMCHIAWNLFYIEYGDYYGVCWTNQERFHKLLNTPLPNTIHT
jgi:hypothetical protein